MRIMKYVGLSPPLRTKHGGRGYKTRVKQSIYTFHRVFISPTSAIYFRYRAFAVVLKNNISVFCVRLLFALTTSWQSV